MTNRPSHPAWPTLALTLALVILAGCAAPGGRLQSSGVATVFDMQVTTDLDWARIKIGPREERWTIDGPALNQLRVYSRIKPDEHVFLTAKETRSRPDGPWFRPGMRPDEVRDVVLDALREQGWTNVEASALRPERINDSDGLRFELDLINASGLIYKGTALAVERGKTLHLLLWLAPVEHYHPRDHDSVARMLSTVRFLR